jgi:cytochrome c553
VVCPALATFGVLTKQVGILAVLWGLAAAGARAQTILPTGDAAAGKKLATQGGETAARCYSCHGVNGEGEVARGFPRLAGFSELYLRKQLLDYQSDRRLNSVMQPMAKRLSPQQVADVAAYYASLTAPPLAVLEAGHADVIERGQTLAARGDETKQLQACASCHGPLGMGSPPTIPALAGQPSAYLQTQLQAWKTGMRRNDDGGLMAAVAQKLDDEDINAVAQYYARARPPRVGP